MSATVHSDSVGYTYCPGCNMHLCVLQETPSIRDRFAMAAFNALATQYDEYTDARMLAEHVYEIADAMLEARKPKEPK